MAQITSGLRATLSHPILYDFLQNALGAQSSRRKIVRDHFRPKKDQSLLDIGCGTGEIAPHLPPGVAYRGIDLSPSYIASARQRYGHLGHFEVADASEPLPFSTQKFDLVTCIGLMHHLDDDESVALFNSVRRLLQPRGRLVTVDPTFVDGQHLIAREIAKRDRGRNVRRPEGYEALARRVFDDVTVVVRHDLLRIPYTHCVLEITEPQ
jgi:SAM-dependent methyltransferase